MSDIEKNEAPVVEEQPKAEEIVAEEQQQNAEENVQEKQESVEEEQPKAEETAEIKTETVAEEQPKEEEQPKAEEIAQEVVAEVKAEIVEEEQPKEEEIVQEVVAEEEPEPVQAEPEEAPVEIAEETPEIDFTNNLAATMPGRKAAPEKERDFLGIKKWYKAQCEKNTEAAMKARIISTSITVVGFAVATHFLKPVTEYIAKLK